MTNLIVLAFGLATNSVSAVVAGDKAAAVIIHTQVEQRSVVGFRKRGKTTTLGTNSIVIRSFSTTNFLPLIQAARPAPVQPPTPTKE